MIGLILFFLGAVFLGVGLAPRTPHSMRWLIGGIILLIAGLALTPRPTHPPEKHQGLYRESRQILTPFYRLEDV